MGDLVNLHLSGLGWDLKFYISDTFPGDANAAKSQTTFGVSKV